MAKNIIVVDVSDDAVASYLRRFKSGERFPIKFIARVRKLDDDDAVGNLDIAEIVLPADAKPDRPRDEEIEVPDTSPVVTSFEQEVS